MSTPRASRVAWSAWLLSLISSGVYVPLRSLNSSTQVSGARNPLGFDAGFLLLSLAFATVGALIVFRRPGNPIGWVFCVLGLSLPLSTAGEEYALYTLKTSPGTLPGGDAIAWAAGWLGGPVLFAMVAFLFLLFPNGRLLSRRWRPALWGNMVALVLLLGWYLKPGPIEGLSLVNVQNPFGIAGAGAFLGPLAVVGIFLMFTAAGAGAVSLILRLRHARGDEREQLKWFAFAGAIFCAVFAAGPPLWSLPPSPGTDWIWPVLFLAGLSVIPAATGIAILKYRLYDIDRLINRALVYTSLTVSLAAIYIGCVLLLQTALHFLSGETSQVAVVVSTLAIAALFNPLRRRVQVLVDSRFYRRKYDAAKTLEAFGKRLRDETALKTLTSDMIEVVRETMQPEHVSLWLRPPEKK